MGNQPHRQRGSHRDASDSFSERQRFKSRFFRANTEVSDNSRSSRATSSDLNYNQDSSGQKRINSGKRTLDRTRIKVGMREMLKKVNRISIRSVKEKQRFRPDFPDKLSNLTAENPLFDNHDHELGNLGYIGKRLSALSDGLPTPFQKNGKTVKGPKTSFASNASKNSVSELERGRSQSMKSIVRSKRKPQHKKVQDLDGSKLSNNVSARSAKSATKSNSFEFGTPGSKRPSLRSRAFTDDNHEESIMLPNSYQTKLIRKESQFNDLLNNRKSSTAWSVDEAQTIIQNFDQEASEDKVDDEQKSVQSNKSYLPRPPSQNINRKHQSDRTTYSTEDTYVDSKQFSKTEDFRDINSYAFSTLNLTKHELREASVNMILATINKHVLKAEKLKPSKQNITIAQYESQQSTKSLASKDDTLKLVSDPNAPFLKSKRSKNPASSNIRIKPKGFLHKAVSRHAPDRQQVIAVNFESTDKMLHNSTNFSVSSTLPKEEAEKEKAKKSSIKPEVIGNLSKNEIPIKIKELVEAFVSDVCDSYTETRYHAFKHAVDVTQMMYLLVFYYLKPQLKQIDPFILIVTCLCHDIGHFGANNKFLKQEALQDRSYFLKEFGMESPLEKFHIKTAKELISRHELFGEEFMSKSTKRDFLFKLEQLILATDMDRHQHFLDLFEQEAMIEEKNKKKTGLAVGSTIPLSYLFLSIKLCDIANVSREFEDAKKWAVHLSVEFDAMEHIDLNQAVDLHLRRKLDSRAKTKSFLIASNLYSDSLILFQEKCDEPEIEICSKVTLGFMAQCALPMATAFSLFQKQAAWFFIDRMLYNMQMWLVFIETKRASKLEDNRSTQNEEGELRFLDDVPGDDEI